MTAYRFRENTRPPSPAAPPGRRFLPLYVCRTAGRPAGLARPRGGQRGLVRSARALAAAALLALSGALALPVAARAQDVVLVSNMAASSAGSALVTSPTYRKELAGLVLGEGETRRAQQFSTGADAAGYTLGSVELNLRQAGGAGSVRMEIRGTVKEERTSTDPVWATGMTVGETNYGHGYDVNEDEGGSLTDADFEYNSTTYTVELVELDDSYAVSFRVDTDGLPEEDILTLEIDGLAFPFEDRNDGR